MARWKDKSKLVTLAGSERIAATSMAGGPKVGGGSVAAEGDIHITTDQLADYVIAQIPPPENGVTVVTEASAFTAETATHAGVRTYVRAGGDVTFDAAETYSAGQVFNLRATGSIELVQDGVTLTPPAGGTLEMDTGMSVTIVMTAGDAGDVIGQTVPA